MRRRRRVLHPGRSLATISTDDLTVYATHRLAQKAAPASVNRELAILRRSFRLAARAKKITAVPHVPMLQEHNTRTGFFERARVRRRAQAPAGASARAADVCVLTGWRFKSEVLPLTVDRVDLAAGVVTLAVGSTKNKEGRCFYVTAELRTVLTTQLASLDALKTKNIISPYVFHFADGTRIKDFRKAWRTACKAAGTRPGLSRLPTVGRPDARTGRSAALDGDGDGRPQDRIHLSPLRDCRRGDAQEAAAKLDRYPPSCRRNRRRPRAAREVRLPPLNRRGARGWCASSGLTLRPRARAVGLGP